MAYFLNFSTNVKVNYGFSYLYIIVVNLLLQIVSVAGFLVTCDMSSVLCLCFENDHLSRVVSEAVVFRVDLNEVTAISLMWRITALHENYSGLVSIRLTLFTQNTFGDSVNVRRGK